MGQFVWTGYDYIGEPTPYHTKNSYFGLIDTAGFYKDAFYAFKSAWMPMEKDPFVHVFPYWDFNEGQLIDVRICSNAPEVELFVNDRSLGRQTLTHSPHSGDRIFADYQVPYEKGEIKAVAYDSKGKEIAADVHKSFGDTETFVVNIDHRLDKYFENNKNNDLIFAEISALDKDGNPVENASDYVNVKVGGDGVLVGLDNGDSTDYDSYQSSCRKLFNGKLLAIVKCTGDPDSITIDVTRTDNVPVRKIELQVSKGACDSNDGGNYTSEVQEDVTRIFTKDQRRLTATARVLPTDATDKTVTFRALNPNGTDTNIAKITQTGNTCEIEAIGDGEFVLRCEAKCGRDVVAVMSALEFKVEGIGQAFLDPYGFIPGSLYTSYQGQIGSGNEHGVASAKGEETVISYSGIDFGKDGSDEITVPIFTLNDDEYEIEIWKGICGEPDSKLLNRAIYQKKSIWNVYQEDTWKLSERLTGLQTISIKVFNKMHIKGFSFAKQSRAYSDIRALDADSIYGDTFTKTQDTVEGIGNNVTLAYEDIDFGEGGTKEVVICGRANEGDNTIHLRFKNDEEEIKEILEFRRSSDYEEQSFAISERKGVWNVSFVFLPGSNFDLRSFRFCRPASGY
jgi:beta-galactosidase